MNQYSKQIRKIACFFPYVILLCFPVVHLGVYFQFNFLGKTVSLSFLNTIVSILYILSMYIWALMVNPNRRIKLLALLMGILSVTCLIISLDNFGPSVNDALFTGAAVLTLVFVFENAEILLELVKRTDKQLTISIWCFLLTCLILLIFFPQRYTQWGEGVFLFGHRLASVCGMVLVLIGLKLINRPKSSFPYIAILFIIYFLCFWTGARIYAIGNLGIIYAVIYTLSKNNKDFVVKCIFVTIISLIIFSNSSSYMKSETIMTKISPLSEENNDFLWGLFNAISNGRVWIWTNCIDSYIDLPSINKLVGSGNHYLYEHNRGLSGHSDFTNILHFHGIIGLMIYLRMFIVYPLQYWKKKQLPIILLIGFLGVWFVLALLNGYASYSANMMSLPYFCVMAAHRNNTKGIYQMRSEG